jgi:hypothetical protein
MVRHFMIGFIAVATACVTFAQEPPPKAFFFQRFGPGPDGPPPGGDNVSFVSAEMAFESKPVTGAPYTAQAVTETTQTLSDGNRISQTTQGLVARDSEGRTRREQTMPPLPGAQGDSMKLVFINDPVAQVNYVLHSDRTADKMPLMKGSMALPAGGFTMVTRSAVTDATAGAVTAAVTTNVVGRTKIVSIDSKATMESLGQQTIEGVQAEGTRTTSVIPAGAIGNEQDIKLVSETWYSNDLQTTISSTHTDPRMGTTTYRLTNIQRAEPSPDLFQAPSDYTVHELPKVTNQHLQVESTTSK